MGGFLGVAASNDSSDLVLLVELAIAVGLVVGMLLVRRGHVRLHRLLQGSLVLVNVPIVLAWMVPQYLEYVRPGLPADLGQAFFALPTLMLAAGAAAEALGVYILLVAGTTLVPDRWRFRRYKLVMRSELILWWAVVLAGIATYYTWYVAPS